MSRLDRETFTGEQALDLTANPTVLTKALPATLSEWKVRGVVRAGALAADKFRTLTLTGRIDGEHLFSTDWIFTSDATDAGRVKRMSFAVPEAIRGTLTLHLLSSEAGDTSVEVDARLNTDDALLDQLPYALDACVIVEAGATDAARGTNLATAYTAACALTPGGNALSSTNRACVLLPPWHYDVAAVTLVLDTQYVDLIATDPQRGGLPQATDVDNSDGTTSLSQFRPPPTVVYSTEDDTTVVEQAVQDVRLTGFAIAQLSGDSSGNYHAFYCSVDDNGGSRYDRIYFWHKTAGITKMPISFAKHVRGTWHDCIANGYAWRNGTDGEFSAVMYDCHAGGNSFIGDRGSVAGCLLFRCKAIGCSNLSTSGYGSFSGCAYIGVPIDADSKFFECEAGERSFGLGIKNEGTFIRCRSGDYCFGATVDNDCSGEFAGYAEDCVAGKGSFGGRKAVNYAGVPISVGKCTGTLVRCIIRESELPTRLEGATIEGCLLTTGTTNQDGVTLLDSGSRIHDSTILVVEGGSGVPINAAAAQSVSAAGNRYNNRSASVTGLGANVTNTGAGEPAAVLAQTDVKTSTRASPDDVHVSVNPVASTRVATRVGGTLRLPEGSDETVPWHLADSDGEDYDLTAYTGLALRVFTAKGVLAFERTLAAGHISVVDATGGDLSVTFTATNLAAPGEYKYELWGTTAGGATTRIVRGPFIVEDTFGPGS